mgnify:CR=1 FL=1
MSSNIEIKKRCRWCGAEFIARKTSTEYCSHRCSGLAYKERKRQARLDSYQQEYANQLSGREEISRQEFLTPTQAAKLLGVCHVTIYNYINSGTIKVWKLKRKTLIRRADVDALFNTIEASSVSTDKLPTTITEFYTSKEIQEKFGVSNSGMYKIAEREGWPKTQSRGKTLWSRKHVDRYFDKQKPSEDITEWYTAADIQEQYGMTLQAIYCLVSKEAIPKKKVGASTFYSKYHFDLVKGIAEPKEPEYYTYPEAMEKYGLTRDQLHHYLKYHKVTRVKKGKYTLILRSELDNLLKSPEI